MHLPLAASPASSPTDEFPVGEFLVVNWLWILLGVGIFLFVWRFLVTLKAFRAKKSRERTLKARHDLYRSIPIGTDFYNTLDRMTLSDHPLPPPKHTMAEQLVHYRYPFTALTLDPKFYEGVMRSLEHLPHIILQRLYVNEIPITVDVVCEIGATMELEPPHLTVSEKFLVDGETLLYTGDNPVVPYPLYGVILHELGHYLDWHLIPNAPFERLSLSEEFITAFRKDVAAIPADAYYTGTEETDALAWYGGMLNLPADHRAKSELTMFIRQEQEVFADILVYLLIGMARPSISQHFSNTIDAVKHLLEKHLPASAVPIASYDPDAPTVTSAT